MTKITMGEAMPKNLTEALSLHRWMEGNWRGDDAAFENCFHKNLEAIEGGSYPIHSPEEACALLDHLQAELQDSNGEFVGTILGQVKAYIIGLTGAQELQSAQ